VRQIETPKEPEVIAELRGWHREGCESLFTIGEVLAVDIADILAAYDAIVAERDNARRLHMVVRNELDTLRAKLDAAVKTIPSDDAERFICLAHPHNHRWEEALCSAKYQLDAAVRELEETRKREALSDAIVDECDSDITKLVQERASLRAERDAAVRERDAARDKNVQLHALVKKYKNKATKQSQKQKKNYKLAKYADESNATLRARLAACERVVEAAEQCSGKRLDMGLMKALANLDEALIQYRAAVAAETCARSAPITVGDTQGETCAKCGGSGYAIDTERSGVGRVVGKKCDCGSVAYITNGTPTLHAGGTDA
jgi:chromosome segregation ATPase